MARMVQPAAPFSPQIGGSLPQQVARIADALTRKADATTEPVYNAVMLIAPGGAVWRLTVNDAGVVATEVVTR